VVHLDLHAGIHLGEDRAGYRCQVNALRPDLVLQTGDMIDVSPDFILRERRNLAAPLGCFTVLGNHDHYTGAAAVAHGVRDAGHTLIADGCRVVERGGAALALLGIDDPENWKNDDPQEAFVDRALRRAPPETFKILLSHPRAALLPVRLGGF
jgi:predicted MPP superfamily phosphohydrolase